VEPALRALARSIAGTVAVDAVSRARAGRDGSHLVGAPRALVLPKGAEDVVAAVRWARARRIPLVPRGAGTSLDGESVPADGAVVVDLSRWTRIREICPEEGWARVDPGVVNLDLQRALARRGVFFPPNPGSWGQCTIGGNVGTNASGPRTFRYGPTRAWVRALDLVLGTGVRAHWGTLAPKRSVGPDLVSLFVGSEGTLGIATEVVVRTAPIPAVRRGLVVELPGDAALGRVVGRLATTSGTGLSAIEFLDRACAQELDATGRLGLGRRADLLLLEVEAEDERAWQGRRDRIARALRAAGGSDRITDFADADRLWSVRGRASVALDRRFEARIREDVSVPLRAVDRLRREVVRIAASERVPMYLFGHLGDGNLHPNFVVPPSSPSATRIRSALWAVAIRLGGTISAEHGIGSIKVGALEDELGSPAIDVLRSLKGACDPDGILNPGKLYPPRAGRRSSPSPSGSAGVAARPAAPTAARRGSGRGRGPRVDPRRRAARP
jgi:FAD/FMN-containing dehydrogenase